VVLNQLYRFTPLQSSFGANMVALDGGRPLVMNLKDLLTSFIAFREDVISRRTKFLLNKARERAHVLVGLAIAVANIDEIIRLIRASRDANAVQAALAALTDAARGGTGNLLALAIAATGAGMVVKATQPTTLTAATVAASASAIAWGAGGRRDGASTVGSAANDAPKDCSSRPRAVTPRSVSPIM